LVGDHPGTIPVEFGQITMSGSRGEDPRGIILTTLEKDL